MQIDNIVVMAIVVGLTELVKKLECSPRLIPLIALMIGVVITALSMNMLGISTWQEVVLVGLINGLGAVGLYSGVTNTINKQ